MVMYDKEFKTKENKIQTKEKIEPQHIHPRMWGEGVTFRSLISTELFVYWLLHPQCNFKVIELNSIDRTSRC